MFIESHQSDSDDASPRAVGVTIRFDRDELTITDTPFGAVLALGDLGTGGIPGAPALPTTRVRIAAPGTLWPTSLEIVEESWEVVRDEPTFVAPAQHARPGAAAPRPQKPELEPDASDSGRHSHLHCAEDCSCRAPQRPDRAPVAEGLPAPEVVPPDPDRYAELIQSPPPAARAVLVDTVGGSHIAVVELAPVRIGEGGRLELLTSIGIRVVVAEEPQLGDRDEALEHFRELYGDRFDESRLIAQPHREPVGIAEAVRQREIAIGDVLNPHDLDRIDAHWPVFELPSEYLIITDDVSWDAMSIRPRGGRPGIVAQFQRLASAKRARGISARVVTITDIVAGRWGDVVTGSRDLQEVIRRFLKIARRRWGVSWLLLGGDVSIVPVRQVAGSMLGGIGPGSSNPPTDNTSFWATDHLRMHCVSLGDWWNASTANQLIRPDTGQLIPYDGAGTSSATSPGWYFTASDYSTRSTTPTEYVRANGPKALLNTQLQFLYPWNTIPTDFYYASLDSWVSRFRTERILWFEFQVPYVYVPEHDWDAVGNGIYGQHHSDGTDLDGVVLRTDLSVGRAPVESAAEATVFVDKTLAYERLGTSFFGGDRSWPRTMLLASSDWGGRTWFWPTNATVPTDDTYHHDSAASRSLLKAAAAPDSFTFELVSRVSETDRRRLPFKTDPNPAVRGWYFATSATDATPSHITLSLIFVTITFPVPSPWIVVHGSVSDRTPEAFELDPTAEDGSMADQERLRKQVRSELPGIDCYRRYYEDEFDLSLFERVAAPVDYLSASALQAGLNAAPHLVSLSGHGSQDGVDTLSVAVASGLTNGALGFIGYADSCLTNGFDSDESMSETLLLNSRGGAVGYVGNTRFSWIGVGDDFQRAFFHRLTTTRHLGLLNDSRIGVYGTTGFWTGYDRWAIFALNLLGDPELRVYRAALPPLVFGTVGSHSVRIVVERQVPVGPPVPGDPGPVEGAYVHLQQGSVEYTGVTDADGWFDLPEGLFGEGEIEATASFGDHPVARQTVHLR